MSIVYSNLIIQNSVAGNGIQTRDSVRASTVVAGTLASSFENGDTIDGVVLVTGNRILIKNQASGVENGIYIVSAVGAPLRADDYAEGSGVATTFIFVNEGTINASTGWNCTNIAGSDVVGTNALVFAQFAGLGANGDVFGPSLSSDNSVVRFDGVSGKLLQNGVIAYTDLGDITGINSTTFKTGANDVIIAAAVQTVGSATLTIPDMAGVNGGSVVTNVVQTLTNKTLTAPRIGTSILDTSGNEYFVLTPTASAVNEFTIVNAATGTNPRIGASGGDANIGIEYRTKGSQFHIFDDDSSSAEIRLQDDAGNDYFGLRPAAATTSYTITMPAAQGAVNQVLVNNGAGVMSWLHPVISNTSATATADSSTTSTTYIVITTMTITPASGTYLAMFSSSGNLTNVNNSANYAIFNDGTIITHAERTISTTVANSFNTAVYSQAVTTVNGSQAIDARFRTDAGTITMHQRSLILIRVA